MMSRVDDRANDPPRSFAARWHAALGTPAFRWRLLLAVSGVAATLAGLARLTAAVELRAGALLPDPLLAWLPARDVSAPSFALIYGGLVVALIDLARRPWFFVRALTAYALMILARLAMMWATPLDPPPGLIPLRDPFVEAFGPGQVLTRDLFFSGHTSTLFLLALCVPSRWLKAPLFLATLAVAVLVLIQHAHYTVDVLVAPCVAFCAFRLAAFASERESG